MDVECGRTMRYSVRVMSQKMTRASVAFFTAAAAMSALDGAGAVHSMLSYELCERGVLVQ